MLALMLRNGRAGMEQVEKPRLKAGEAVVRVRLAGVCRTDLELMKGYMDFAGAPGHEFVGEVEECGEAKWLGKRVTGEINLNCGSCEYCRAGLGRHCPTREVLGIYKRPGALAEFLALPIANLHEIPDGLGDETAVFVEPLAACFEILEQVNVKGKSVLVIGDGKLGILAARLLKVSGVKEIVLQGRHPEKLALVKPDGIPVSSAPGKKFDVVVEASGRAEGFASALAAVKPRGVIAQKSTVEGKVSVDLSRVVVDEITVVGSRCGPFAPSIRALREGKVRVKDLISARYPLSRADEALMEAAKPGRIKVLVEMGGQP